VSELATTGGVSANGRKPPPVANQFGQPNGNPIAFAGAPRGTKQVKKRLRNALIRKLRAHPDQIDAIVDGLINGCAEGDAACQRIAWDRVDGIQTQKHEHQGAAVVVNLILEDK
jgi:hypothetical protein